MTIPEILSARFSQSHLKGFRKFFLNERKNKFIAYSLISVNDPDFSNLKLFYGSNGYSINRSQKTDEDYKIYSEDGKTYQMKDLDKILEEGLLKYLSILFYGCLYKDEWYILDELCYYEEPDEENTAEKIEEQLKQQLGEWNDGVFKELKAFNDEIDYSKIAEMLSEKSGKKIEVFKDYKDLHAFIKTLYHQSVPMRQVKQSKEHREFVGMPWIVAHCKQETKARINRDFENYINAAVFIPFVAMLKFQEPVMFSKTYTLYHPDNYPLIYPHSKEYVIAVVKAVDQSGKSRLYYFLYVFAEKKIYEWTLPKPGSAAGHHAFNITDDIKNLSAWGEEFDLFEPSLTMDDRNFWDEHVFKKQGKGYKYLQPVLIKNNQQDIFPLF